MALPLVSGLADPPSFGDLANFGADANAFVGSLPAFMASVNSLVAAMNAMGLGELDPTDFAVALLKADTAAAVYTALGAVPAAQIRSDLPADKAFRRGNFRGTVSQSSGTPTGALIERVSNANGSYVRYADGTQICMMARNVSIAEIPVAGIYYWTMPYPAAFAEAPYATGGFGALNAAGAGSFAQMNKYAVTRRANSSSDMVFFVEMKGQPTHDFDLQVVAVGRWF